MIFYFSGTGNTRWAAERLAETTQEKLLSIAEELKGKCEYELQDGERIGFCFPTHGWQPPRIVRQFIRKMHIGNAEGHYCYALTTCGDSIGQTMDMFDKELAVHGITVASHFSLVMPESYVCLPFMYTDTPEREKEKISKSDAVLNDIVSIVTNRVSDEDLTVRGAAPWLMSHVIGSYFNGRMVNDKKFTVDADACIHCGKCKNVCPTDNLIIDADSHLPQWKHDGSCTCCLACYHYCPQHAINYGKITRKRGQYYFGHH